MGQFCHDETWFEASGEFIILLKWDLECYEVDRRCGVAEVKGVAELLGSAELGEVTEVSGGPELGPGGGPELRWRSGVGVEIRSTEMRSHGIRRRV